MKRDYVTIVSGVPRSGTSMMMRMIDRGGIPALTDHVRRADEDNPHGYFEFEPVKKVKADGLWIGTAAGRVLKMVHLLLLDLPLMHRYRVVLMQRNLDEVVASQNAMLSRFNKSTDDLPVKRLVELYSVQLEKVRQYMRERPEHFQFREIDYNYMLRDPLPQAEELSRFLDGLDVTAMIGVVDGKLYRNRATPCSPVEAGHA
ncbi:MAG: sulfotransferase family protein [Thermoguttaceae bacterium]|jgi:hypothetical protein